MGMFVPKGFEEDGEQESKVTVPEIEPLVVVDAIFLRHGEQMVNEELRTAEDRLSPVGREQAVSFGKSLEGQDGVYGFCGGTNRAREYLSLVLTNCSAPKRGRIRTSPALDALDTKQGREKYNKKRQQQVEELAHLVRSYRRFVHFTRNRLRITFLFVSHTHVNETLLEKVIMDPKGSNLFDPEAVVRPFAPGDYWTLRTSRRPDGGESNVILLRKEDYPINNIALNRLADAFAARP